MAKQKKNSNYVTEKNIEKKEAKDLEKRKAEQMKTLKTVGIISGSVLGIIGMILLILLALGVFDYVPEPTYHVTFNFDNQTSLHIELYGNDAPETVEHFLELCNDNYFNNMYAHTLLEGLLYIGSEDAAVGDGGVYGEFKDNGFNNKIEMKAGVICMARGDDYDSAYGQFFVLLKDNPGLKGKYAAFGKITDTEGLEALLSTIQVASNGKVVDAPKVISVSTHAAHH